MASALEQHLRGAQKFLDSCGKLPNFVTLQKKQFDLLSTKVAKLRGLTTPEVPAVVAMIEGLKLKQDQKTHLQAEIAEKVVQETEVGAKPRRSMQDFTNMAFFFTKPMWADILRLEPGQSFSARQILCQKLCKHLAGLGLECPSEPTIAFLMAILFHTEWNVNSPSGSEMYDTLQVWKPIVKKLLKRFKVDGLFFLASLPDKPALLPEEIYQVVFCQLEPVEPPFDPACLQQKVDLIPMRSSNAATKVTKLGSGMVNSLQEAILQYMSRGKTDELEVKYLKQGNTMPLSNLSLPLKDFSRSSSQASLTDSQSTTSDKVDSQPSKPESEMASEKEPERLQVVKSLAKQKAVVPRATPGKEASPTVAAQIANLQGKINAGKPKAPEKDEHDGEKKKPKASKKKGAGKKAPKKQRVPAAEPEKVVDAAKDTRKRFTSRAYHRALQASLKAGIAEEAAKEIARAAHRSAAQQWDLQVQSA